MCERIAGCGTRDVGVTKRHEECDASEAAFDARHGAAFAVLAIYVLTLLLPLHQSAALQRDLNAIGYSTLDSWSVCQPMAQNENGDPVSAAALTCPAMGVAKHQLANVLLPVLDMAPPVAADIVRLAEAPVPYVSTLPDHVGQSRAPPVAA